MINSQQRLFKEHLVLVNPLWQQKVGNQYISNEIAFFLSALKGWGNICFLTGNWLASCL